MMDVSRREVEPGWIVEHNRAHEAVVTEVKEDGVRVRHTPRHAGRDEPEHEEFIPWEQVTAVRAPDRFGQIIERLKAIRSGALRRDDESFETLTNDSAWLVMQLAEESRARLRLTEERDQALNALREARQKAREDYDRMNASLMWVNGEWSKTREENAQLRSVMTKARESLMQYAYAYDGPIDDTMKLLEEIEALEPRHD